MKHRILVLFLIGTVACDRQSPKPEAVIIEDCTWYDARELLTDTTIVVIPLGAAAKEHGPHLLLKNDLLIAEYLKEKIAKEEPVVIYPTINYHYYPAFLEYAGSTSLQLETATNMLVEICQVIARHGPRKFYILNTGVSTIVPLKIAAEELAQLGLLMHYTDILNIATEAEEKVREQAEGTHADEIETSMMLYMAPATVDMSKAAKDIPAERKPGSLTPYKDGEGNYSPTGIYGDATLASVKKGRIIVEAMVDGIKTEIRNLRTAEVPAPAPVDTNEFTGVYYSTNREEMMVELSTNNLLLKQEGRPDRKLSYRKNNTFTIGTIGTIVFIKDPSGKTINAFVTLSGRDFLYTKK